MAFWDIIKEGEIARDIAAYNEKLVEGSYNRITESGMGNYRVGVMGMEAEYLPAEEKYFHILEGKMDAEKFAEGGYMVYQAVIACMARILASAMNKQSVVERLRSIT